MGFLKRLLFNREGKVSVTKLGGQLIAVAGTIAMLPEGVVPAELLLIAKATLALGVVFGVSGARDAMDKIGEKKK